MSRRPGSAPLGVRALAAHDSKGKIQFSQDQFPPDITQDDRDKTADEGSKRPSGDTFPQRVVFLTLLMYVQYLQLICARDMNDVGVMRCFCNACCAQLLYLLYTIYWCVA